MLLPQLRFLQLESVSDSVRFATFEQNCGVASCVSYAVLDTTSEWKRLSFRVQDLLYQIDCTAVSSISSLVVRASRQQRTVSCLMTSLPLAMAAASRMSLIRVARWLEEFLMVLM